MELGLVPTLPRALDRRQRLGNRVERVRETSRSGKSLGQPSQIVGPDQDRSGRAPLLEAQANRDDPGRRLALLGQRPSPQDAPAGQPNGDLLLLAVLDQVLSYRLDAGRVPDPLNEEHAGPEDLRDPEGLGQLPGEP